MKFIRVDAVVEDGRPKGYLLDPDAYLAELPAFAAALPEGARRFAEDPDHYDFFGPRCVKDLKLDRVVLTDREDAVSLEVLFAPNRFKHDRALSIRYADVTEFAVDVSAAPRSRNVWPETRRLGDLQLDEVLPRENGCGHEIRMTGGTITVVAADLVAEWVDVDGAAGSGVTIPAKHP
ncbi:hypothetical protein [Lentzea sp. NBRC 102530]|uniref:hypothetical protein n=1 Tax=Lentzea sp. NBRC 102530 TaxID=3032201 RepID=UPI0024A4B4F8|nr:hypothetical protein [Lentzea sp. NBRC 102530]GLY52450.1 hypothetical protein Lesp01_61060 [Lentzea sp. NBRC 102530]